VDVGAYRWRFAADGAQSGDRDLRYLSQYLVVDGALCPCPHWIPQAQNKAVAHQKVAVARILTVGTLDVVVHEVKLGIAPLVGGMAPLADDIAPPAEGLALPVYGTAPPVVLTANTVYSDHQLVADSTAHDPALAALLVAEETETWGNLHASECVVSLEAVAVVKRRQQDSLDFSQSLNQVIRGGDRSWDKTLGPGGLGSAVPAVSCAAAAPGSWRDQKLSG
jgi:hypothetical protein